MVFSELGKTGILFCLVHQFDTLLYYSHKEIQFCQNLLGSTKTDPDPEVLRYIKRVWNRLQHIYFYGSAQKGHRVFQHLLFFPRTDRV